MKHKHSISCLLAAAAAASMACSCTKEDAARFEGDYSFKTSGTLTISADGTDGTGEGTPQTVSLVPESGQMEMVKKGKSKNDMVITMNILGGDAVVFGNASADERVLTLLEPYTERRVAVTAAGSSGIGYADVTISGSAEKFTDVVLFSLEYSGTVTIGDTVYTIIASDVDCVAHEND